MTLVPSTGESLKEIHEIMEKIYNEEKNMNADQRAINARNEAEKFLKERNLKLKRIPQKEISHTI